MLVSLIVISGRETAWLNLTNAMLGIAVLLCCALIAGAAIHELTTRASGRAHIMRHADAELHALLHGRGGRDGARERDVGSFLGRKG